MQGLLKNERCEEITLEQVQEVLDFKIEEEVRALIVKLNNISGNNVPKQCFKLVLQQCASLCAFRTAIRDLSSKCTSWEDAIEQEKSRIMEQLDSIEAKMEKSDAQLLKQIRPKQKLDLTQYVFGLAEFSLSNNFQSEMRVKEEIKKHPQLQKKLQNIYEAVASNWWNKGQVEALHQSKRIFDNERQKYQDTIKQLKRSIKRQIKTLYDIIPKGHEQQQFEMMDEQKEHKHMLNILINQIKDYRLVRKNALFFKEIKKNMLQFLQKLHSPFEINPNWIIQSEDDIKQQLDRIQEQYRKIIEKSLIITKKNEIQIQKITNNLKQATSLINSLNHERQAIIYDSRFPNEILLNQSNIKRFLVDTLQKQENRKIECTRLVYRWDPFIKTDQQLYINNVPNIFFLVKLTNGRMIGCYSNHPFSPECKGGDKGLIIVIDTQKVFRNKKKGKAIVYDNYQFIFGNSQVRLKLSRQQVFINLCMPRYYYQAQQNQHLTADTLLGQGNNIQTSFESCQVYQIVFEDK